MKLLPLILLASFSGYAQTTTAQGTSQRSSGNCSPNLSGVTGPVTIQFSGDACQGIDQASVKQINAFLERYPEEQNRLLELLNAKDASLKEKVQEIATLTVKYDSVNNQLSSLGRPEHMAKMIQMNTVSEKDRQNLDGTIRNLEAILAKTKFQLTPENLVRLGWYCTAIAQFDKAIAFFLDATKQNPSLGSAYLGLAYASQMQGSVFLQQQDPDHAQEALNKAAGYAKIAQQYDEADVASLVQLGYAEKDLAQIYSDKGLLDKAKTAGESALRHFKMALGADPNDPGAHNGIGNLYYDSGDLDAAIREYQLAAAAAQKYTFAWYDLVVALRQKYAKDNLTSDQKLETFRSLVVALKSLLELTQDDTAQQLPQTAIQQTLQLAQWATAEAAKYKKSPQ